MESREVEVLILAGGKGTRLKSIISDLPKPMAPIGDVPFLEYIVKKVEKDGFKNIVLLTGYLGEKIEEHFSTDAFSSLNIRYSKEESPLGTGGAIKKAIENSRFHNFLILNGDTLFNINLNDFLRAGTNIKTTDMLIGLCEVSDTSRYGSVSLGNEMQILKFFEKNDASGKGLINAGIYLCKRNIVSVIEDGFVSLESEVMPKLVSAGLLFGASYQADFIDIGIPSDYFLGQDLIPKWINLT